MENKELVDYWLKTAEHDYKTMLSLFKSRRYSDCLFYGHIVLEKTLKAFVVRETKQHAPFSHDLLVLYRMLRSVNISEDELNILDDVNRFNIRSRYPDFKFYKQCTAGYTKKYLEKIKKLYNKLCQQLRQSK